MIQEAGIIPDSLPTNLEELSQLASQRRLQELMDERVCPLLDEPFLEAAERGESDITLTMRGPQLAGTPLAGRYDYAELLFFYEDDPDDPLVPHLQVTVARLPKEDDPKDTGFSTIIELSGPWTYRNDVVDSSVTLTGEGTRILAPAPTSVGQPAVAAAIDRESLARFYQGLAPTSREAETLPPATVADVRTVEQVLAAAARNYPEHLAQAS